MKAWVFLAMGMAFLLLGAASLAQAGGERPWRASDSLERAGVGIYAPKPQVVIARDRAPRREESRATIVCVEKTSFVLKKCSSAPKKIDAENV